MLYQPRLQPGGPRVAQIERKDISVRQIKTRGIKAGCGICGEGIQPYQCRLVTRRMGSQKSRVQRITG